MKHLNTVFNSCLLALFLSSVGHLIAADAIGKKPTPIVPEPNASAAWQRRIPDYMSDALPLNEIIQHLRQQYPEINFLIKQQTETEIDVGAITVRMTVRAVTLQEFLRALEIAAERPIQITGGPDERLVVFESKSAAVAVDAAGLPLRPVVQTRVFNISRYLERSNKEEKEALAELNDVLQLTGALLTEANRGARPFKPKLHIHRGTKLLIAVGSIEELNVIDQVVNSLQNSQPQMKGPANSERATKSDATAAPPAGTKQ
jgi:hypothetical protein